MPLSKKNQISDCRPLRGLETDGVDNQSRGSGICMSARHSPMEWEGMSAKRKLAACWCQLTELRGKYQFCDLAKELFKGYSMDTGESQRRWIGG